jgi:predicted ribosomally synthesized peptide with SipW-like signal peptide
MFKGLLLSLLTIGGVAFIVGGATFAPFSDSGDATGDVSAGTLTISINGDSTPDPASLVFDSESFCGNMAPGDICETVITIANTGSLTGQIVLVDAWIESLDNEGPGCSFEPEVGGSPPFHWEADVNTPYEDVDNPALGDAFRLLPSGSGDSTEVTVEISLNDLGSEPYPDEDLNDCQGSTANVVVHVEVEQDDEPHATDDTLDP